ncbi:putative protein C3P1 [Trachypithecus francoisi]|uniref:putative protein C3P1 n=1 Tax=Trachypithecus francoisi TaxID=54180 RepID=UPI00141BC5B7|nr:putative protein C3P1 [Trachypithecus francoisi]
MDMPWPLGWILLLLGSPLTHAEPLYILVTPRVLRVGSPESIHIQAHSDSRQPLTRTLQVNLTVPESLVYPPKPGQQYAIIQATWAPSSGSLFMEKIVLVAPHAGYIFIQTDKTIYTPEHLVHYRVFTVNHKMDPVTKTFTLDIKNPEGITVISQSLIAKDGFFFSSFHLPELVSLGTWTIEASYQSTPKQKFKAAFDVKEYGEKGVGGAGGQIQQTSYSIVLEPQGQTQTKLVPRQEFLNMVPDTEVEVFISVQGYTRMLTHRSSDGTYHTSKGNPGSTWLTSYVFRVFALAYSTMTTQVLSLSSLCDMANWIITDRQAEDGHFLEEGPVVMTSMQGGYQGSEEDVSLTALVLIALNEGKELCNQKNLMASIERARGFLERKLPDIQTTFAIAIASYALALANSSQANDRLDSFASPSGCGMLLSQPQSWNGEGVISNPAMHHSSLSVS